jgi:hypothetical protein
MIIHQYKEYILTDALYIYHECMIDDEPNKVMQFCKCLRMNDFSDDGYIHLKRIREMMRLVPK